MSKKSLKNEVSKGVGQMFKLFTFQNPFSEELYYIQYKKNGQLLTGSAVGRDAVQAGKNFLKTNPDIKLVSYRRFSMHLNLAEKWHFFGGN